MSDKEAKSKKARQGLARARLIWKRDLAWTMGFPLALLDPSGKASRPDESTGVTWFRMDAVAEGAANTPWMITREVLRRSELAASKLRHQFPKAVDRLFDAPEQWFRHFDELLASLKPSIHHGCPLVFPSDRLAGFRQSNKAIHQARPRIGRLIEAIARAELLSRSEDSIATTTLGADAIAVLNAIDHNADKYGQADIVEPCGLTQSAYEIALLAQLSPLVEGASQWVQLGRLLTSPTMRLAHFPNPNVRISSLSNACRKLLNASSKPIAIPERQTCRNSLVKALRACLAVKPGDARAMLKAVCVIGSEGLMDSLESFGMELYAEEKRLSSLLMQLKPHADSQGYAFKSKSLAKPLLGDANPRPVSEESCRLITRVNHWFSKIASATYPSRLLGQSAELMELSEAQPAAVLGLLEGVLQTQTNGEMDRVRLRGLSHVLGELVDFVRKDSDPSSLLALVIPPAQEKTQSACRCLLEEWLPAKGRYWNGESFVQNAAYRRNLLPDLWTLLTMIRSERSIKLTRKTYEFLPKLVAAKTPMSWSRRFLEESSGNKSFYVPNEEELNLSVRLSETPNDFWSISQSIDHESCDEELFRTLLYIGQTPLGKHLVRDRIVCGRWKELAMLAGLHRFVGADMSAVSFDKLTRSVHISSSLVAKTRPITPHDSQSSKPMALRPRVSHELPQLSGQPTGSRGLDSGSVTSSSQRTPDWFAKYPQPLHQALCELHEVSSEAEQIARRILASDIVDVVKHQRERAYLQSRLEDQSLPSEIRQRLEKRSAAILQQIQSAPVISRERLNTLCRRIMDRAALNYFNLLKERLSAEVCCQLQIEPTDLVLKKLGESTQCGIALGISGLSREQGRSWGRELFRLSLLERCFDELGKEPNQKFVEKLVALGINVGPWLDLERTTTFKRNEGGAYLKLKFGETPLDYLLMGHHFGTCLSPTDFNFFSAISNAIDVNKRVLYARYPNDRLAGRCLLALDAQGRLVRYATYCHDPASGVDDAVESFMKQLAEEMRTTRSSSQDIPRLVSSDWYDDGPVGTDADSPSEPIEILQKEIQRLQRIKEPDDLCISSLTDLTHTTLRSLEWKPDLLRLWHAAVPIWMKQLFIKLINGPQGDLECAFTFAANMLEGGDERTMNAAINALDLLEVQRLFRRRRCRQNSCYSFHLMCHDEFLIRFFSIIDPTQGLRILRSCRKRHIKKDLDETDPLRRKCLAKCHERLGRTQLSESLSRAVSSPDL